MKATIGIRREDKNKWERRTPIIPDHIRALKIQGVNTIVQPSPIRIFPEIKYKNAGAEINENLSEPRIIFAVKEIPIDFFEKEKTYIFFSHTIKGQEYNMPMLKKMMELKCNLIDYEKIIDNKGRRLVFFGKYAGLAGMIDTLWAFGKRLKSKRIKTIFDQVKKTIDYKNLEEVKNHFEKLGEILKQEGLPKSVVPLIIGIAGYGNVSQGVQEILDFFPTEELKTEDLNNLPTDLKNNLIYKVVFKEKDMVEPISENSKFKLQEYYEKPQLYKSVFEKYIPKLSILMNCIFWNEQYPRLVTKEFIKKNYDNNLKLQVIGDISVDINGAIEFTEKTTKSDNPVFTYNPTNDEVVDDYTDEGIVVMAVDNLPCELPEESSKSFSNSLLPFIPSIAKADYKKDFINLNLPLEVKKAVILYHGKLTPDYQYINKFL